jgi:O-antigen/teichoic acid export membrane protein
MTSLKQKTVSGLLWSFVDNFANLGLNFIVGIILARLLTPAEFGLLGMITIFIAISQSFINSGFGSALIRKKNCTQHDYSTVFFFNLVVGIGFYFLLFFCAHAISNFFNKPQLEDILKVLGLLLIIESLTMIQRIILIKRVDFKLQARITVISSISSGFIAIYMAYKGFGVWSLVVLQLSNQAITSFLLWIWNQWKPQIIFNMGSFKELFGFGSKLLLSSLLYTAFGNIYYPVIGKFFSAQELGFYTRAQGFSNLPSQNLNGIIARVTYPILAGIQDDIPRLRMNYEKLIRSTMFITFPLMLGMAAIAKPMVLTLIGENWLPSVVYLQMLCFVGMFYPLHALNLNMLLVRGRSDLFLKLEIIKIALAVPIIMIGIFWGIKIMIAGMMVNAIIAYSLNSFWSGKMINYPFKHQVKDILPAFFMALGMAIIVFSLGIVIKLNPLPILIIQIITGAAFILIISEITNFKDYIYIKLLVLEKIPILRTQKNGKT